MNAQNDSDGDFPKGKELLDNGWGCELQSSKTTMALLASGQLGKKAPRLYENLGAVLSLLSQLASCQWGCRGGDHDIENLVRRCCNYALSALSLARSGYYDESIALVRGVAETVNLLQVFDIDRHDLQHWKTMPERERKTRYGPAAVRRIVEQSGKQPAIENDTYSALCEMGVHVTPNSMKTSHQHDKAVHVGASFSVTGFLMVINELGICLSPAIVLAGRLIDLPENRVEELLEACNDLRRNCSTYVRATNYRDIMEDVQRGHARESEMDSEEER